MILFCEVLQLLFKDKNGSELGLIVTEYAKWYFGYWYWLHRNLFYFLFLAIWLEIPSNTSRKMLLLI